MSSQYCRTAFVALLRDETSFSRTALSLVLYRVFEQFRLLYRVRISASVPLERERTNGRRGTFSIRDQAAGRSVSNDEECQYDGRLARGPFGVTGCIYGELSKEPEREEIVVILL